MGYTTSFKGVLKFSYELSATQLAAVKAMCGEDCRDYPDWNTKDLYYIDLVLTDDFMGLVWSGAEKTCDMDKLVNVVITQMRKKWPDFGLTGQLQARGEDADDKWNLLIRNGLAVKVKVVPKGKPIECPHCHETFRAED